MLGKLLSAPCSTLCRKEHKLVTVDHNEDVVSAFDKLAEARVLSAPCRGPSNDYIGFLDMRDLVALICFAHAHPTPKPTLEKQIPRRQFLDALVASNVTEAMAKDGRQVVMTPAYLARRNRLVTCLSSDPLSKALELLAKTDAHRVMVVDEKGAPLDIISQSNLLTFLQKNHEAVAEALTSPVEKLGTSPVVVVNANESALSALKKMDQHHFGGLPVLAADGELQGNISASDLKLYLHRPLVWELHQDVMSFLQRVRQQESKTRALAVTVSETDTLGKALGKLIATKMHRIYVVGSNSKKPSRVVSMSDILRHLHESL